MSGSDKSISYSLLDFGGGRKLERFGSVLFDRPCPAAEGIKKKKPSLWKGVSFRFKQDEKCSNSERGQWLPDMPRCFTHNFGLFSLELRGTPFGHLGVFPEQIPNWQLIHSLVKKAANFSLAKRITPSIKVLNLFAYTGGSSLAAAGQNTEVVHLDSSKSVVNWANRNAELNGIKTGIRFIAEDARRFVNREIKRNNRYDAVILDPPSYGHGTNGEIWQLGKHLPELLADIAVILNENPVFLLLTAHTPLYDGGVLNQILETAGLCRKFNKTEAFLMDIPTETGDILSCGNGVLLFS